MSGSASVPDADAPRHVALDRLGETAKRGGLGHDLAGRRQELASCGGQRHPGASALEQRDAERLLERPDLGGQRRLADVQPLGRPGQVTQFGDGCEAA